MGNYIESLHERESTWRASAACWWPVCSEQAGGTDSFEEALRNKALVNLTIQRSSSVYVVHPWKSCWIWWSHFPKFSALAARHTAFSSFSLAQINSLGVSFVCLLLSWTWTGEGDHMGYPRKNWIDRGHFFSHYSGREFTQRSILVGKMPRTCFFL